MKEQSEAKMETNKKNSESRTWDKLTQMETFRKYTEYNRISVQNKECIVGSCFNEKVI